MVVVFLQSSTRPRASLHLLLAVLLSVARWVVVGTENLCLLKVSKGTCNSTEVRWAFNTGSEQCEPFEFSGCGGNENNFPDKVTCLKACRAASVRRTHVMAPVQVCDLPLQVGKCGRQLERWYFNRSSQRCQSFVFTGCMGNRNNFRSVEGCRSSCEGEPAMVQSRSPDARCTKTVDPGPCAGRVARYYFNSKSGECEAFTYGGCRGNGNNFESTASCMEACITSPTAIAIQRNDCSSPSFRGSCEDNIDRWFYDIRTGDCASFIYSGCSGNMNNFESYSSCRLACVVDDTGFRSSAGEMVGRSEVIADAFARSP